MSNALSRVGGNINISLSSKLHREKPHDEEWTAIRDQKVPLLLNYAQCKLLANEFYPVIEHCSEVLEIDPGIVNS